MPADSIETKVTSLLLNNYIFFIFKLLLIYQSPDADRTLFARYIIHYNRLLETHKITRNFRPIIYCIIKHPALVHNIGTGGRLDQVDPTNVNCANCCIAVLATLRGNQSLMNHREPQL